MKGTIKKVVQQRGFGFITVENGKDVFFHRSSAADFDSLEEGDSVEFDVEDSPKGERAANVKKV
ncbi:cold shock domain-containing protein [bacterium]|nr:cold shock domain-containing protein [bacterium]MCG2677942.1 cold shock domain-containing protein [bacterium]